MSFDAFAALAQLGATVTAHNVRLIDATRRMRMRGWIERAA